jgi:uncharacterized coiled-coil protein SlyX
MTDDLVKRLRQFERWDPDQKEAADRIEELEKVVEDQKDHIRKLELFVVAQSKREEKR